ncbi:MAG: tetratricopeptide repeat protein [Terriglobia bacterium]
MSFWRNKVIEPALDAGTDSAIREQEEFLRQDPSNPHPHLALGALEYLRGNAEIAIEHFRKALELDPGCASAHVGLGRIYAVRGQTDLAWQHARAAAIAGNHSLLEQLERYPSASRPPERP